MNKLISTNPGRNYKILGQVNVSTNKEIKDKVLKAQNAKNEWKNIGLENRIGLLGKVLENLKKRREDLVWLTTKEMGMTIRESRVDVDDAFTFFTWYLENAKKYLSPEVIYTDKKKVQKVFYEPLGVAAVIIPWNFPLSNFVWGCGQNLIVGNTVVLKHSEEIPLFGKLIEEIIKESGLPEGVFSEVYGDGKVGDYLVHQDIDLISFTGSTKVGKYLYKIAGDKFIKAVMECGGSAPGIVYADADLDSVIDVIYGNRFTNCGQMCDALKRLIVHNNRFDEVVERLKKKVETLNVGYPEDESTDIGPLVAKRQVELLEDQVEDAVKKGAKIIIGGKRPKNLKGAYYMPTILTNVKKNMRVWKEEVFGPVLPVVSFKTESEAIKLANDTNYGLGAQIYTKVKSRALRIVPQLESGMVSINTASYINPCSPFGGYKDSGIGREHGKFGFHELTKIKVVGIEK